MASASTKNSKVPRNTLSRAGSVEPTSLAQPMSVTRHADPANSVNRSNTVSRLSDRRNALGHAFSELEQALFDIGAVVTIQYTENRAAPVPNAASNSRLTTLDVLQYLDEESRTVCRRAYDFVRGEDEEDRDDASSEDEDGDDKPRNTYSANSMDFGRKIVSLRHTIDGNFISVEDDLIRIEDALLSRADAQTELRKATPQDNPESVIEIIEYLEGRCDRLIDIIGNLTSLLRANF